MIGAAVSSKPSQIPVIAANRDMAGDPPCPVTTKSLITPPMCISHAECEFGPSKGTSHQTTNQTPLTVQRLPQPVLFEPSVPDGSISSATVHAKVSEGFFTENERIGESDILSVQTGDVLPQREQWMDPQENPLLRHPAREEVAVIPALVSNCKPPDPSRSPEEEVI